jgi:hypothetical protein
MGVGVSSRTSWSNAACNTTTSDTPPIRERISATAIGWLIYGPPFFRTWPLCFAAAYAKADKSAPVGFTEPSPGPASPAHAAESRDLRFAVENALWDNVEGSDASFDGNNYSAPLPLRNPSQ